MNTEIEKIKKYQVELKKEIKKGFLLISTTDDIDELFTVDTGRIRWFKKLLKTNIITSIRTKTPSIPEAVNLLNKKKNKAAIIMLKTLSDHKIHEASLKLGIILMNGVKNKVGKIEFKNPKKALEFLKLSSQNQVKNSTYYLGLLLINNGYPSKGEEILINNHKSGCIKSSSELIVKYHKDINSSTKESDIELLRQKISNIKADLKY